VTSGRPWIPGSRKGTPWNDCKKGGGSDQWGQ
jgi:hypothetical protein